MNYFLIIVVVLAVYFFGVFVVLRLFAPFMGFGGYKPPIDLPEEVKSAVSELESQSHDQMSYLVLARDLVNRKWRSARLGAVRFLPRLFRSDLREIWNSTGYAHCTTKNFVLYALLANSRYFRTDDVKPKHQFFNMVVHQYLLVRVDGKWTIVDPSKTALNVPLGRKVGWFG